MMPELLFLPPDALDHPYELPPLPRWLEAGLGLAGAVALAVALALILN
jgi:hypothetical protein